MARYFMHIRDGLNELLDPEGRDFSCLEALQTGVLYAVRDLMSGDAAEGVVDLRSRIDAEDSVGRVVYCLPFRDAVTVISGA
jgi:hypothetical protein